jgi:hypothetical protein
MAAVPNLLGRRDYTCDDVIRMDMPGLLTGRCEIIDDQRRSDPLPAIYRDHELRAENETITLAGSLSLVKQS